MDELRKLAIKEVCGHLLIGGKVRSIEELDILVRNHQELTPERILIDKLVSFGKKAAKLTDAKDELIKPTRALINFIEENNVFDSSCDDGDGYTEEWKSKEFNTHIEDVEKALEERS